MRKACIQCFLKHIGNAAVLTEEVLDGYPYTHLVLGHLDQAAQEIRAVSMELSHVIRAHRLKWLDDTSYSVPYEALEQYASTLELVNVSENTPEAEIPVIPEECYQGLDKGFNQDGESYNLHLGDARNM